MASSLEELAEYFEEKTSRLNRCLELRGINSSDGAPDTLRSINKEVTEIEDMLVEFKEYLSDQKALLQKAENIKGVITGLKERSDHIACHLPQHLPGRKSAASTKILKDRNLGPSTAAPAEKKPKAKVSKKVAYRKTDYLTTEEFERVPKYLKGRLTYSQVNSVVDQINKALAAKYKILATPRQGMSELVMTKFREFKDQETPETKSCSFFIDKDLKEYSSFKLDKNGQSILNILRHCGKLKEVRGGKIVRFVVNT